MQKIGLNIFCEGLCEKKNLTSTLGPDSLIFSILARFSIFKVFYAIKTDIWSNENVSDFHLCNFSKISISYFLFKSKFGAKCILNCSRVVFIKRSNDFLAKKKNVFGISYILKEIGSRRKFSRQFITEYLRLFMFWHSFYYRK